MSPRVRSVDVDDVGGGSHAFPNGRPRRSCHPSDRLANISAAGRSIFRDVIADGAQPTRTECAQFTWEKMAKKSHRTERENRVFGGGGVPRGKTVRVRARVIRSPSGRRADRSVRRRRRPFSLPPLTPSRFFRVRRDPTDRSARVACVGGRGERGEVPITSERRIGRDRTCVTTRSRDNTCEFVPVRFLFFESRRSENVLTISSRPRSVRHVVNTRENTKKPLMTRDPGLGSRSRVAE